jgi:uncharacterized membrane protein SpoIIM required for sporulation/ABC-type transport system involved in multi-copper enzyme maturation permease subunit
MWGNLQPAIILARREIRDQLRDWRIIFPVVVLTLFFPVLMNFTARRVVSFVQQYGADIIAERFIPFLLMIVGFFPITVSLVIALESFAGERERHSIEPLLCSPLHDWQLYLGKLISAMAVPIFTSYLGIIVYLIGLYSTIGWLPEPGFLVLVIILTSVQALVMVSGAVLISTQTTSVRAANLLASFVIIPMALLIQGESAMMLWADYPILWWAVFGQVIIAALLIRMGITHFNREEALGREWDSFNLAWAWRTFRNAFVGRAKSPFGWYRLEVIPSLQRLALPIASMSLLVAGGMWIGNQVINQLKLPIEVFDPSQFFGLEEEVQMSFESLGLLSINGVSYIWLHNLRVILLAATLGVFTFGVLGVLIMLLPIVIIGAFSGLVNMAGLNALAFLAAFVLPHGILELPAIILTGAVVMKVGATLVTPAKGSTIGEAFILALADWARVTIALILPLFFGAAILETFVTPRIVTLFLSSL